MGHYLSEMPDIETAHQSESVAQLWDWINTTVDVLRDHGGTMRQADLEKQTSRILGVSIIRMPWVINNAVAERKISRGGPGKFDILSIAQSDTTEDTYG